MALQPTYPGVYVQEIPSGVRTITGVATSITAFLGTAKRGLTNIPIVINNFGDFERQFGGLSLKDPMSYAVRDFYLNGGAQAVIVRIFSPKSEETPASKPTGKKGEIDTKADAPGTPLLAGSADGIAKLTVGSLMLQAASPGTWGNKLKAYVTNDVVDDVAEQLGVKTTDMFNLYVYDGTVGTIEVFRNLTITDSPRRVDMVLANESNLVRAPKLPASAPVSKDQPLLLQLTSGSDDEKKKAAQELRKNPFENASRLFAVADGDEGRDSDNDPLKVPEAFIGSEAEKTGLYALEKTDLFNLLCIPPATLDGDTDKEVYKAALAYCVHRRAMLIVDSPIAWGQNDAMAASKAKEGLADLGLSGTDARHAILYFPRIVQANPLRDGQIETFVPCGAIAGMIARTDTQRGLWKAPAGMDATLNGIRGLQVNLSDAENGILNPLGINCLRSFPVGGRVVWGARTLRGADQLADEYKYVPVRRLLLYIEESLYRGTQWAVFEPNDEPLWGQLRLNISSFMNNLFRQGAFQGSSSSEAYFVKCDKETTTQSDINLGIVNIHVGFAPLKPAEFVMISIQQIAGALNA